MIIYYCDNKRHLVCVPYSVNNLHLMAQKLNIKRCWYRTGHGRHPHYDIPKSRITEIQSKCVVISERGISAIVKGYITII